MKWQNHNYDQLLTTSVAVVHDIKNADYKIFPKTLFAEQIYQGKKFCPALPCALP
jgi:hypothetical protein